MLNLLWIFHWRHNYRQNVLNNWFKVNGSSPGGGEYVARLMLSIKSSEVRPRANGPKTPHSIRSIQANLNSMDRFTHKRTFTLFAIISDAYMIDPRYNSSNLSFRLCLGPFGYSEKYALTNQSKAQTSIRLGPKMPCFLSFDKAKPCLSLQFEIEDLRYYMYCKNFLQNSVKELMLSSVRLLEAIDTKVLYEHYSKEIVKIQLYVKSIYLAQPGICELEVYRALQLIYELTAIIEVVQSLSETDANFRKLRYNQIRDCIDRIHHYLTEPFSFFPDVNLWLLADDQPIGICTLHSNDVIWARNVFERGCICGQLVYTDVKVT